MSSRVRIHMNICEKISTVTISTNENGNYDVKAASSCENVKEYVEELKDLTIVDLTDKMNSRILDRFRTVKMSANCAVPSGVITAAWMEAGLISKSRALQKESNVIEFLQDKDSD